MTFFKFFVCTVSCFCAVFTRNPLVIALALFSVALIAYNLGYDEGEWEAEHPDFEETMRLVDEELEREGKASKIA